ncbi:hypothetical protein A6R68_16692, partial [Neotoma lepida]
MMDSYTGVTCTVPIFNGCTLLPIILYLDLTGQNLTDYLTQILIEHMSMNTVSPLQPNENFSMTSWKSCAEMAITASPSSLEKYYKLPDRRVITISKEWYGYPRNCDVTSTGKSVNSVLPGTKKIQKEIIILVPRRMKTKIIGEYKLLTTKSEPAYYRSGAEQKADKRKLASAEPRRTRHY